MTTEAIKVTEIIVKDPDTNGDVAVEIWKDPLSGGIFGVDSSYLEQDTDVVHSPFNNGDLLHLSEDADDTMESGSFEELFQSQAGLNAKSGMDTLGVGRLLREAELDPDKGAELEAMLLQAGIMLHHYINAVRSETQELADCQAWKHWYAEAKAGKQFKIQDLQNARVEVIDLFFFWMSLAQVLGLDTSDIYRMYRKKSGINHRRQDEDRSQAEHGEHEAENQDVV